MRRYNTELVGGDTLDAITFPPWIMHEARDAWMSNGVGDVTESASHTEIASIIGGLGVRQEVERLTAGAHTRPLPSST